ncbi:DUF2971 domain-containing protein [Pseudomonas syringae]|uniref:DUF2971 domain-containing protein n=1 Tax=Pseudomonas syringae TaxID=317 RepID=UPI0005178DC3|nr:DUF2971 domain-containing protein [Pseudomonas syringae]
MLERDYAPKIAEILYHYCSAETFLAICTGKKLRFSDINSMNDSHEMKWGYSIWEEAATQLHAEVGVGVEFLDEVDGIIHASSARGLALASCFSKAGDLLSQWRAYGDNGHGYAIGFDSTLLREMASLPLEILYNREQQIYEVKNAVQKIYNIKKAQNQSQESDFQLACFQLYIKIAALKNPAFQEENEVRLIHMLETKASNQSAILVDVGGTAFGQEIAASRISFSMRDNCPAAYIDLSFECGKFTTPIKEVILGPKNQSIPFGVSIFLETIGLPSVVIKQSQVPYR